MKLTTKQTLYRNSLLPSSMKKTRLVKTSIDRSHPLSHFTDERSCFLDENTTCSRIYDGDGFQEVVRDGNTFTSTDSDDRTPIINFSVGFVWHSLKIEVPFYGHLQRDAVPGVLSSFFPTYRCYTGVAEWDRWDKPNKKQLVIDGRVRETVCCYGSCHAVTGYVFLSDVLEVSSYGQEEFYDSNHKKTFLLNSAKWETLTKKGKITDYQKTQLLINHINNLEHGS